MRVAIAALLVIALGARGDASSGKRVVLADADPELLRAVVAALAPWRLEIVVVADAPASGADARTRAEAQGARFVVWRAGRELIVFDRDRGAEERRDAPEGALDAVDAAAAALTVKTLMRLPPPEELAAPPPPPAEAGLEIRLQAAFATRIARGSDTNVSARFVGGVSVRPIARLGLRIGAVADLGTASDVDRFGFTGAWSDWSLAALAGWTFAPGPRWELEPYAGAGFARSSLAGTLMNTPYDESATLALACGGMWVRRRFAMWTLGAGASLEWRPGTPTYTRDNGSNQTIFQVPSFGVEVGVLAAADFGR